MLINSTFNSMKDSTGEALHLHQPPVPDFQLHEGFYLEKRGLGMVIK
ncbi:hypothetical protein Mcup_1083 [Metallosphaera cuprina Ar-4]|uniref:Uncharacterized protein n=1 Tax=Metallosphaera cuprina (strain Ar-4) TaxID=1006006 RepID=F4G2Z0_METCR|nr:hypothetical protein Mcup_1083 [Metallosphaera cuprina Ar-4]